MVYELSPAIIDDMAYLAATRYGKVIKGLGGDMLRRELDVHTPDGLRIGLTHITPQDWNIMCEEGPDNRSTMYYPGHARSLLSYDRSQDTRPDTNNPRTLRKRQLARGLLETILDSYELK